MKTATLKQVEIKHRARRKALSSGQAMLGKCLLGTVNRPRDWKASLSLMRLREIEKIIRLRHGAVIPDPEDTDDVDLCIGYIRAAALSAPQQKLSDWCARFAPWALGRWDEISAKMQERPARRKRMLSADAAASLMWVTMRERAEFGLKTIGACDLTKAERKSVAQANKRERDRNRQERKRRELGMADRKSQQALSLATTKPWEAEGISRRTWFYRQKQLCTAVSLIGVTSIGDTPVQLASQPDMPPTPQQAQLGQSRVAGLVVGLGDHPPAGLQGAAPHGSGDFKKERAA